MPGDFNVVILGNTGSGKSALSTMILTNKFSNQYNATIGYDTGQRTISANRSKLISINISDLSGTQAYNIHVVSKSDLILYCVSAEDIMSRGNTAIINELEARATEIKEYVNCPILLTITKTDKAPIEDTNIFEIQQFLTSTKGGNWINKPLRCSAKDSDGKQKIIDFIDKQAIEHCKNNAGADPETLHPDPEPECNNYQPQKDLNFSKWFSYAVAIIGTLALIAIPIFFTITTITTAPLIFTALAVTAICCLAIITGIDLCITKW